MAVLGLILIILSVLPYTSAYVVHGLPAGIALVVIGVVLYIVLSLVVHAPVYDNGVPAHNSGWGIADVRVTGTPLVIGWVVVDKSNNEIESWHETWEQACIREAELRYGFIPAIHDDA